MAAGCFNFTLENGRLGLGEVAHARLRLATTRLDRWPTGAAQGALQHCCQREGARGEGAAGARPAGKLLRKSWRPLHPSSAGCPSATGAATSTSSRP